MKSLSVDSSIKYFVHKSFEAQGAKGDGYLLNVMQGKRFW
jgi:hypothetical protein